MIAPHEVWIPSYGANQNAFRRSEVAKNSLCAVSDCGKPSHRRGFCSKHYQRVMRHGDPFKTHRNEGAACSVAGCVKLADSLGLCGMHYKRLKRHGDANAFPAARHDGCSVDGCGNAHKARGFCILHYNRVLYSGSPKSEVAPRIPSGERIRWLKAHVDFGDDERCLIWPYSRDHNGYGRAIFEGRASQASRVMAILAIGRPPSDRHQAAHSCGNGHLGCVNPRHLRWDTCTGNHADKERHGTLVRGEKYPRAKLTQEDVRAIRLLSGGHSQREIGAMFGVGQGTVGKILRRKLWAHVE